jgi:hypothetical protein
VWYCSQQCADHKAWAHKKLCYKSRHTKPTQADRTVPVIQFPWDGPKPFVKFVGADTWAADILNQGLVERTPSNTDIGCIAFDRNGMTGRPLPYTIKIIYRHWIDQQSDKNRSLQNCFNLQRISRPRIP